MASRPSRHVAVEEGWRHGTTFILTVIDLFSKLAWCVPLKNKSAASLVPAFTHLLSNGPPNTLRIDKGHRIFEPIVTEVAKRARCASFCDAQRRNEGEHCREIQSNTEGHVCGVISRKPSRFDTSTSCRHLCDRTTTPITAVSVWLRQK